MPEFAVSRFEEWTGGRWCGGRRPGRVGGFAFDSRILSGGDCFVALSTGGRDGHAYVADAAAAGAACALVERELPVELPQLAVGDTLAALGALATAHRSGFGGPVVGITGSAGKTSTKNMLIEVLGRERTLATPGNWNNLIGVPMTLLGINPDRHRFAVVEAGISEPGEMDRLGAMIAADIVVVTSIGRAHLEGLGSVSAVAREKAGLLRAARPDATLFCGPGVADYPDFITEGRTVSLGREDAPAFSATVLPDGRTRVTLGGAPEGGLTFEISGSSLGMAANAALAAGVGRELGIADADIVAGLGRWAPERSRGRIVEAGRRRFYVDCYNANPDSMADALAAFECLAPVGTARCFIIGQMDELGDHAAALHRETGRRLGLSGFDRVYLVGRGDLLAEYRKGIEEANGSGCFIEEADGVDGIADAIRAFEGPVFLKASRSLGLERLVPAANGEVERC